MKQPTRNHVISDAALDTALRDLDVADATIDPYDADAEARLHAILAADSLRQYEQHQRRGQRPRVRTARTRHARLYRRGLVAAGIAAVATVGLLVAPSMLGGDQAFATWTPGPQAMTPGQATAAADSCRDDQEEAPYADDGDPLAATTPVITERRGTWTTVILAAPNGFSALCVTDDSSHWFARDMIGSDGFGPSPSKLAPRQVVPQNLGVGTMSAGDISLAAGVVGADVAAITYHSPSHGTVHATVAHGYFAFWVPGNDMKDYHARGGVPVDVTMANGTTVQRSLLLS